ncbi:MAG TPA: SHOCT domain-containing protein [Vicinamibacteria bacterium]
MSTRFAARNCCATSRRPGSYAGGGGSGGVGAGRPGGEDEALAILRRRYAAGELDQATFERMRREPQAPPPPAL